MSRALDYLKATIQTALGDDAAAFWTEYRRLARLDNRDSEARLRRRRLNLALTRLNGLSPHDSQYQRWCTVRDSARAWLAKYGYSEED